MMFPFTFVIQFAYLIFQAFIYYILCIFGEQYKSHFHCLNYSRKFLQNTPTRHIKFKVPSTTSTKTYQNICLQKAVRIKRHGYVNKYTNPRKAETTTSEYITVIQDLNQQA
jgi:hypothetical protein